MSNISWSISNACFLKESCGFSGGQLVLIKICSSAVFAGLVGSLRAFARLYQQMNLHIKAWQEQSNHICLKCKGQAVALGQGKQNCYFYLFERRCGLKKQLGSAQCFVETVKLCKCVLMAGGYGAHNHFSADN